MQVINNELNVFVDVDQTLLMWINPTVPGFDTVEIKYAGTSVHLTPHNYHVQLVRSYKERGYTVFVWSANGVKHAERAVAALQLQDSVDFVMAKPIKHLDDNPDAASILGPRVYCEDLTKTQLITVPYGYMPDALNSGMFILGDNKGVLNGR